MAAGRFISNGICADKNINRLSDDTSRLAFTWLITFADCEGRTYGDPAVIRSMLFPRRQDVTIEQMENYLNEWAEIGMIVWYESQGDKWIWFPNFDKHQNGLRKDREAASKVPQPPQTNAADNAETLRTNSGVTPDQLPVKLIKENLIKGDDDGFETELTTAFTSKTGIMPYKNKEWTEASQTMCKAGVTPDDILSAVDTLRASKMNITGLWSITKTAIAEHAGMNGNGHSTATINADGTIG